MSTACIDDLPRANSIQTVTCSFLFFCFLVCVDTQAAACELEEEAHLHEGTWHTLMKDERTVAAAGKYSTQIFYSYLVVDPVVKGEPRALDDGEFIEYIRGVSLEEVCGAGVCAYLCVWRLSVCFCGFER